MIAKARIWNLFLLNYTLQDDIGRDSVQLYTYRIRIGGAMQKKLTITIDEKVYEGLHTVIGRRRISSFVESVVRPHVIPADLSAAYRDMAAEEEREAEALEWSEATMEDVADAAR
jgi:hypothetical protein